MLTHNSQISDIKRHQGDCSFTQRMQYFPNRISILLFTRIIHTVCIGQFFQITVNDIPENTKEPLLANDAFECSRRESCTTVLGKKHSTDNDKDSNRVIFNMSKTNGM